MYPKILKNLYNDNLKSLKEVTKEKKEIQRKILLMYCLN